MQLNTIFKPKEVANTLLEIAQEKGVKDVTPMKLQKLLFYAHGWHLEMTGQPLITDSVQAWEYGPVIEGLYHDLKRWGNKPIQAPITELTFENEDLLELTPSITDPKVRSFLGQIVDIYGGFTAVQLSNMTHKPGTPWAVIAAQFEGSITQQSVTIPDELIKKYFADVRANKVTL